MLVLLLPLTSLLFMPLKFALGAVASPEQTVTEIKAESKVKGSGQECPLHTGNLYNK
jgi:hypothetical protein